MRRFRKFSAFALASVMGLGAVASESFAVNAAGEESPQLTIEVEGPGTVSVDYDDVSRTITAAKTFEEHLAAGTVLDINATADVNAEVASVKIDGKNHELFSAGPHYQFDWKVPEGDSVISVEFANIANIQEGTASKERTATPETEETAQVTSGSPVEEEDAVMETVTQSKLERQFQLTPEEEKAITQYQKGDYTSALELRKKKVEEYDLQEVVDSDYFLTEEFLQNYGIYGTSWNGMLILDPNVRLDYESEPYINMQRSAGGTVTNLTIHYWYYGGGGYMDGGTWDIATPNHGSQLAFCANGMQSPPPAGTTFGTPVKQNNENLRKALYYGYNGPQNKLTNYSKEQQVIFTNDLVSMANTGTCISANMGGGWIWRDYVSSIWNQLQSWPSPPSDFVAYIAPTSGSGMNWQGITTPYQPLAYGVYEEQKGHLSLQKQSSNTTITDGNNCYDFTGTEYTVYDKNKKAVGKLTILDNSKDNWSNIIELPFGDYTYKETTAGKGYALDPTEYKVTIGPAETHPAGYVNMHHVYAKDNPQSDPIGILLQKVDSQTDQGKPQGSATLEGAEFTVKFFAGINPNIDGTATRTWVIRTDSDGFTYLDDAHKVSGDAFYKNSKGIVVLPLGTVTIQETKAPQGYYINNERFVRTITASGQAEDVKTYNAPKVPDVVNELILTKVQIGTTVPVGGTIYTHTKPDGSTEDLTTDENGQIKLVGLALGEHKILEKTASAGYVENPHEVVFKVTETGITMITDLTDKNMEWSAGKNRSPEYGLKVNEEVKEYDLKLIKINEHDKILPGAEFTIYEDEDCTKAIETLTTNETGVLVFEKLEDRKTYYFKETKAPAGYRIPVDKNGDAHVYELRAEATPAEGTFNFYVDGVKYTVANIDGSIHLEDGNGTTIIAITVINYTSGKLPETGSNWTIKLIGAAIIFGIFGYVFSKNRKCKTTI